MLIYKNTFENIKTLDCDFPIEDQYYANDFEAIVADGITRDPVGVLNFTEHKFSDMVKLYPRPSGAELAAKEICESFSQTAGTLKERLVESNKSVKALNDKYIKECDYLQNDYYAAVASCVRINGNVLEYAYICDSGVIVYDKLGNVKFQTQDDKAAISQPYINSIGISWFLPEARVKVRKDFRNNLNNIQDGKCVSFGALTGEDAAAEFIKSGQLELDSGDSVLVYSDGLANFLHDEDFINQILNFNEEEFQKYILDKSIADYDKYGSEKTIVLFKI
ncbi:MAG: protein phosphatase 2C domain-containing protein [Erysipelotrichales bacterium]|nr:protein phosphatase 2C domain-containing protein [Erysipelotrichales bacterium]